MNKELEILKTQYSELSRSFLVALQNDRSSKELEVIREQMKEIIARMEELGSTEHSPEESL
jgi:hypothetical protein